MLFIIFSLHLYSYIIIKSIFKYNNNLNIIPRLGNELTNNAPQSDAMLLHHDIILEL